MYSKLDTETSGTPKNARLNNNGALLIANSGQGAKGNKYRVKFVVGGGNIISANGLDVTLDIDGVTDGNSWQTWNDNAGFPNSDVPNQVGATPSTYGFYIPYPGGTEYPLVTEDFVSLKGGGGLFVQG